MAEVLKRVGGPIKVRTPMEPEGYDLWKAEQMAAAGATLALGTTPAPVTTLAPAPTSPRPTTPISTCDEESGEDETADVVMPAVRAPAADRLSAVTLCCYACADPVLTAEEVEDGYCDGRRCKAKMHPTCFLHHAGEAGAALGDLACFCQACWAKQ